jgi:hypothetical protein
MPGAILGNYGFFTEKYFVKNNMDTIVKLFINKYCNATEGKDGE